MSARERQKADKVIDLMEALKASLAKDKAAAASPREAAPEHPDAKFGREVAQIVREVHGAAPRSDCHTCDECERMFDSLTEKDFLAYECRNPRCVNYAAPCEVSGETGGPTDTQRLDWWFAHGMEDSVCDGSVDLWWADDETEKVQVTHGTSVRDAIDKAMRGIYEPGE